MPPASDAYSSGSKHHLITLAITLSGHPERSLMYNPERKFSTPRVSQRFTTATSSELDPRYLLNLPPPSLPGGYYSYHLPNGSCHHNILLYTLLCMHRCPISGVPSIPSPRGPVNLTLATVYTVLFLEDFKQTTRLDVTSSR